MEVKPSLKDPKHISLLLLFLLDFKYFSKYFLLSIKLKINWKQKGKYLIIFSMVQQQSFRFLRS